MGIGAIVASATFMSKSTNDTSTCATAEMMRVPPGLPDTRTSSPSLKRSSGEMVLTARLPGSGRLFGFAWKPVAPGSPTDNAKLPMWSFRRMPVPGMVTPEPKDDPSV